MKTLTFVLVAGAAASLAACGDNDANDTANASNSANASAAAADAAPAGNASAADTASASAWPEGSRIVVENGVTYRIDPAGARVRLEAGDSRIVVENGVSYRVDPDGARVRLDPRGAAVRIGDSTIKGNAPNGRSDVETPGEAVTDAAEDAVEAVGDVVPD